MKRVLGSNRIVRFIFFTFLTSILYLSARIILAPAVAPEPETIARVKSDYVFMLVNCILGLLAMMLPGFLKHRLRINIPSIMVIVYAVFLYCAIYLGEVRAFYYIVPHWDTILHTCSGAALGALGFSLINLLNKSEDVPLTLSPIFVALFAYCFAVSLGAVWEIYEFSVDYFTHTNMQRHTLASGKELVGQAALMDTMKDLIVDSIGAFVISVVGYISLKYEKGWLARFQLTISEN